VGDGRRTRLIGIQHPLPRLGLLDQTLPTKLQIAGARPNTVRSRRKFGAIRQEQSRAAIRISTDQLRVISGIHITRDLIATRDRRSLATRVPRPSFGDPASSTRSEVTCQVIAVVGVWCVIHCGVVEGVGGRGVGAVGELRD